MDEKQYMFVITACDGRHESEPGTWEEAHQLAANWHDKPLTTMLESHGRMYSSEEWEGMDGQITRVEVVGAYDALMKAECGDEDGDV